VLFSGHPVDLFCILYHLKVPVFLLDLHAAYIPYYKVTDYKKALQLDLS